ncbi:hypothetical protein [Azospirillum sp. TSO22-1]|uniref:hypothetical protein n=1 Tax=Azospirillum sp. TSO22-1 TaxID=716789 RepID=UPI0011B44C15|nr:hypothetical protein [Azospirillum sp. TSO22-1]
MTKNINYTTILTAAIAFLALLQIPQSQAQTAPITSQQSSSSSSASVSQSATALAASQQPIASQPSTGGGVSSIAAKPASGNDDWHFRTVATIIAALIAAVASVVSVIWNSHSNRKLQEIVLRESGKIKEKEIEINRISKESDLKKEISLKMAQFRLEWINNLGDQFAIFHSCAIRLGFKPVESGNGEASDVHQQMFQAATRIELLMNHQDPAFADLKRAMHRIDQLVWARLEGRKDLKGAIKEMKELDSNYVELANGILKREWQRTKKHLREDTVEVSALKSDTESPSNQVAVVRDLVEIPMR